MRILGIDPGLQRTGFAVVDVDGVRLRYVASGTISTLEAPEYVAFDPAIVVEYDPEKKGSFSYPCLIQTVDGLLHISYSYSLGSGKKTIKHIVVDPNKIIK